VAGDVSGAEGTSSSPSLVGSRSARGSHLAASKAESRTGASFAFLDRSLRAGGTGDAGALPMAATETDAGV
jgi:hypothetical protein